MGGKDSRGAVGLRPARVNDAELASDAQTFHFRRRERPESAHLARLASAPELVPGPAAAQNELQQALQRLLQESERRQLDRLLEKDRAGGLTTEEKLELQRLMLSLAREPQRARAAL